MGSEDYKLWLRDRGISRNFATSFRKFNLGLDNFVNNAADRIVYAIRRANLKIRDKEAHARVMSYLRDIHGEE